MRFSPLVGFAAGAAMILGAANAAPISLGGYDLDTENFATGAQLVSGSGRIFQEGGPNGAYTAQQFSDALSGSATRDGFLCESGTCVYDVSFLGGVQNQAGDDLVLFGLGAGQNELFDLTINGVTLSNLSLVDTGATIAGTNYALVALALDLSSWNLAMGQAIDSIRISMSRALDKEEFSAFASLNSDEDALVNPIPASFILFLFGGAGLMGAARRKLKLTRQSS